MQASSNRPPIVVHHHLLSTAVAGEGIDVVGLTDCREFRLLRHYVTAITAPGNRIRWSRDLVQLLNRLHPSAVGVVFRQRNPVERVTKIHDFSANVFVFVVATLSGCQHFPTYAVSRVRQVRRS